MEQLRIGITGLPNAGKTTLGQALLRILTESKIPTLYIPEVVPTSPLVRDLTGVFDFNVWSAQTVINKLIEAGQNPAIQVVLAERAIQDHIAFFKALQSAGLIDYKKAGITVRHLKAHEEKENLIIFLEISTKTSRARDQNGDPSMPFSLVANPTFLSHLRKAYQQVLPEIPDSKLCKIDGRKEISKVREIALQEIHRRLQEAGMLSDPKVSNGVLALAQNQGPNQKGGKRKGPIDVLMLESLKTGERKLSYTAKGRA